MCLCKDTNFKANHNNFVEFIGTFWVVCAYAKILILKQITTRFQKVVETLRCMCLCKDTNFKANHNVEIAFYLSISVVCAYAKILILKQITTGLKKKYDEQLLYVPMQRY